MGVRVLGLDIGGLTLKFAAVNVDENGFKVECIENSTFLPNMLAAKIKNFVSEHGADFAAVGVASSGEIVAHLFPRLSDGIKHFQKVFAEEFTCPIYWINHDSTLAENKDVSKHPYDVAAANWRAQAILAARAVQGDFLNVDTGSSSTDITPVIDGKSNTSARFDYERLATGELVYTGGIFTNPACVASKVKLKGKETMLCSESYALVADVHFILGNINSEEYESFLSLGPYSDTSLCLNRLAHMVYADDQLLTQDEITAIARQIHNAQLSQIISGIRNVWKSKFKRKPQIVVSGSAADYLAAPACAKTGFKEIIYLEDEVGKDASIAAPAVGVAVLAGEKILERR